MDASRTPSDPAVQGAVRVAADLAGIGRGTPVLLVHDARSNACALDAVRSAIDVLGAQRIEVTVEGFLSSSTEPSDIPEVTISLASPLLTHTDQLRLLLTRGSRYINLRGIDEQSLLEAGMVDFERLDATTKSFAAVLENSHEILVSDDSGSHVTFAPLHALPLSGLARRAGTIGGYPSGEVAVVPVPDSVNGVICNPVFVEGFAERAPELIFEISQGQVVRMIGGENDAYLRGIAEASPAGRTVGEFGMGTNSWVALRTARTAKKRMGTAHFGIGDNQTFGGRVVADHHIDIILQAPSVTLDDQELLRNGAVYRSI